jgi:tRNA G18 (ribose-2'-O)-methylase SpoU
VIVRVERADDPRLEAYARVADPHWLRTHQLFVAEGRLVVSRLIASPRFRIHSVLVTPTALAALPGADVLSAPVFVAEPAVLNAITGIAFHRGCLALASRPEERGVESLLPARRLVALEGVGNPDNVGGLFRVAAAFDVGGVLLDATTADPLYRKAIRTSMGAALQVPFARDAEWPAGLATLRAKGFRVLALTPHNDATSIEEVQSREPWVLLAGAEGPGLSDAALAVADETVRIPTSDAVDSLNVTVAVGIALSRLFE